jgi:hypothetical protein
MKTLIVIIASLIASGAFAQSTVSTMKPKEQPSIKSDVDARSKSKSELTVECLINCGGTEASQVRSAELSAQATRDAANSTQKIKNTPSVSGPPLVSSNDTCMGSTSGSVNIAGLGLGGGTSWVDTNCRMLKNSREMWNMGMKAAALALMCTDDANKAALEMTGYECPQTTKEKMAITKKSQETDVISFRTTD